LSGLGLLADAAGREYDMQKQYADPPFYPQSLYNSLGEAYLDAKSPVLAAQAFEKALELTRNDIFALSGLVRAYAALGEKGQSRRRHGAAAVRGLECRRRAEDSGARQGHRHHGYAARLVARAAAQLRARAARPFRAAPLGAL
jgi:GNAT superfamily N-acetyltransferase